MTSAILLATCAVVCLALAGAVLALVRSVRRLEVRLGMLEGRGGLVTGASAPSSTSEWATSEGAGGRSSTSGPGVEPGGRTPAPSDYVITQLGQEPGEPVPALEARLFADLVLRESVVKAASWAYAVRRGLSAENRNRIRFEMRREVKRARKHRKAEEREAIRQYRARRRADVRSADAA